MEALGEDRIITATNWQSRMLETVEYDRPANDETFVYLSKKMVGEVFELVWDMPNPQEQRLGRLAVLSPTNHEEYFSSIPFLSLHKDTEIRQAVASEFGDLLWYVVAFLAEKEIDMPEVLTNGWQKMTNTDSAIENSSVGIDTFHQQAIIQEPECQLPLSESPFVPYAFRISSFLQTVDPRYAVSTLTREEIVNSAAELIWATSYMLHHYCGIDLQTVLDDNYRKLSFRAQLGIPQGQDVEDPRWVRNG